MQYSAKQNEVEYGDKDILAQDLFYSHISESYENDTFASGMECKVVWFGAVGCDSWSPTLTCRHVLFLMSLASIKWTVRFKKLHSQSGHWGCI